MSGIIDQQANYLVKDLEGNREYLRSIKSTVFPEWTDDSTVNIGNFILDSQAMAKDGLNFYIEKAYQESSIRAKTRRGIKNIANFNGYTERLPYAATCSVSLNATIVPAEILTVEKGTVLKTLTKNSKSFQTANDIMFDSLTPTISVDCEYSVITQDTFTAYGRIWENFILLRKPFLEIILVTVDGNTFTRVDNFSESSASDEHFLINIDDEQRAILIFGNGTRAKRANGNVVVDYKYTALDDGYIEENSLKKIEGSFQDTLGNPVTVTINSNTESTHSRLYETVNEIRLASINTGTTKQSATARSEFESIAYSIGGVARALMLSADSITEAGENRGSLFIVPVGGGIASDVLLNQVETEFDTVKTSIGFGLSVVSATYKTIEIDVMLYFKDIAGMTATQKANKVYDDLVEYFDPLLSNGEKNTRIDFGFYFKDQSISKKSEIPLSTIFDIVRDSEYVQKVDMQPSGFFVNGSHSDVAIELKDFPYFKRLKIVDGDTGTDYEYNR